MKSTSGFKMSYKIIFFALFFLVSIYIAYLVYSYQPQIQGPLPQIHGPLPQKPEVHRIADLKFIIAIVGAINFVILYILFKGQALFKRFKYNSSTFDGYCKYVVSKILLIVAFFLLLYEIAELSEHLLNHEVPSKALFKALIWSTVSVAFVGMHRVVEYLLDEETGHTELKSYGKKFAVMLMLIFVAVILAIFLVIDFKVFSKTETNSLTPLASAQISNKH